MWRLAKGTDFLFAGGIWRKTGQRSARPCHFRRQPVRAFKRWEIVVPLLRRNLMQEAA